MSHFNLGNSAQKKKFIGPQHRLPSRPSSSANCMTANLENIGGRIMVEHEMIHHKLRMREVKPSVDAGLPWAHRQQLMMMHQQRNRLAEKLHTAADVDNRINLPNATNSGNRPQSASVQRPATATSSNKGRSVSSQGVGSSHHDAALVPFDVTALSPDHQKIYRDMIRVLCGLDQSMSKALLEHMYREAEDKKLLMAYTGVFPDEVTNEQTL